MKHDYANTSWIGKLHGNAVLIDSEKIEAALDAAMEEIFGKPMTEYEESEWKIGEALNAARNN